MKTAEARRLEAVQDPELYSFELDWFLTCRDSACGVRSSLGGQIEAIGRGGTPGKPNSDPYHDGQAGLGPRRDGAFAMDRRILGRWSRLDRATQEILVAHYVSARPIPTDPDREWEPGKSPPHVRLSHDYSTAHYVQEHTARIKWPPGVDSRLGRLSGVALFLTKGEALTRLLKACEQGRDQDLQMTKRRAEKAIRAAHQAYYAARDLDDQESDGFFLATDSREDMPTESYTRDAELTRDQDGVFRQHDPWDSEQEANGFGWSLREVSDLGDYE